MIRRRPLLLCLSLGCAAGLGASLTLAGCEEGPPQFTLQQVMLEIDGGRKGIERALSVSNALEQARASAESMEWWARDAAFDRYLERSDLPANPDRFPALQEEFEARLGELSTALGEGSEERARLAYPELLSTCDACHAVYRPDLIPH